MLARTLGLLVAACTLASCTGAEDTSVIMKWGEPGGSAPVGHPAPAEAATRPGFVGHDGRRFTIDGRPVPLVGMNIYNAASTGNCWYDMRDRLGPTLDTLAAESGGGIGVIRVWFFQNLATINGGRDWTAFDGVLATAKVKGLRVIPVLTDQWGACEGPIGAGERYKSRTWYESGYRQPGHGGAIPYREWVAEVVSRYRDEPTVALWSLVNEAEAAEARSGACRPSAHDALKAFTDDVAAVVKAADPDHLLALGTIGSGQCGSAGSQFPRLHSSPLIDICEYHDYDEPEAPMPGDRRNGLATRLDECAALGKPLLVGEAGIDPDAVGGRQRRAELFRKKLDAQLAAGVAGFLAWGWAAPGEMPGDPYGIGPGDPVLSVLGAYGSSSKRSPKTFTERPPMGFRYDTRFTGSMDAATVRELVGSLIRKGLVAAGYEYFLIDDGWAAGRDADGRLLAGAGFPGGITAIADHLHEHGLKLGLYATPAARTCSGGPGSRGAVTSDVATFAGWGVDMITLDWCGAEAEPEAAQAIAEEWRDAIAASDRDMLLTINTGPRPDVGAWASQVATSWRVANETCASWFNRTGPRSPDARDCYDTEYHDGVYDVLSSITSADATHVGPGRWADPGALEAGNPGLTREEARTQVALWSMWSAPLIAAHDPRTMDGTDIASDVLLNADVIAVAQDPLGSMATLAVDDDGMQVWQKRLDGGEQALLLLNASEETRDVRVDLPVLGLEGDWVIRDVWTQRDLGTHAGTVAVAGIPLHASVLLRLEPGSP